MTKTLLKSHYQLPVLVVILLFGFFTRIIYLDAQSIWADEAFTYITTQSDTFWQTIAADVHPPLYFMMITGWTWIAGISEFSLRMPSVLAGMLAMASLTALSREIIRHRPHPQQVIIPVIAALLFALSDLEVMVAQEARSYTLHGLWVILSLWMYLRWIRTEQWRYAVFFVMTTLLIIFTHYIGVFTPIALGLHALLFLRGRQRILTITLLVITALLFTPWLWFVIIAQQIGKFAGDVVPAYSSNLETLWYFRLSWFTDQWALMLGIFFAGFFVIRRTSGNYRLESPKIRTLALLILWIVVPLVMAFSLNLQLPVLFDYRLTQITAPIIILMAYGLANFDKLARMILIAVIIVYGVFIVDVFRPKLSWETYTEMITEFIAPGQAVVSEIGGGDYMMDYYLVPRLPANTEWTSTWQWRKDSPENYESGMLGFVDTYDTVWLARWTDNSDAEPKLRATGHIPTMRRVFTYEGNQLEIIRFDRLPENSVMRFENGMILQNAVIHEEGLVDLWWQSDSDLSVDYTVSVKFLNEAGEVIAGNDNPPQLGTQSTSSWQVGQIIYDPHDLETPVGDYQVMLQVYQWTTDGLFLQMTETGDDFFIIER